jgi:hypothetical protein
MGRVINPDYFKVGAGTAGSGVSKLGRFADDRSRLAATLARLHREASHPVIPTGFEKPRTAGGRPQAKRPVAPAMRPSPPSPGRSPEASAVIELFHTRRPLHGRKRRSSKKRHEVEVLRSLAAGGAPGREATTRTNGGRREAWRALALDLLDFAKEVALTPLSLARILGRLRREEQEH